MQLMNGIFEIPYAHATLKAPNTKTTVTRTHCNKLHKDTGCIVYNGSTVSSA